MNKLILILLMGVLFSSLAMAETYKGSTSASFIVPSESLEASSISYSVDSLTLIWIVVGIILFLTILYLLFKKKKKVSRKKKL
jgi:hypothetical protein